MLMIVKALLVGSIVLIIFMPRSAEHGTLLYLLVFLFSMGLVYLYWKLSYWVSDKDARQLLDDSENPLFSLFVGKVPAIASEDLQRGRLVITQDEIKLYQKSIKPARGEGRFRLAWSIRKDSVKSVGFGKVAGARKGFILYLENDEISFTSMKITKLKPQLFSAMGWNQHNQQSQP